jgi:hypothetical protein
MPGRAPRLASVKAITTGKRNPAFLKKPKYRSAKPSMRKR